jgi:hypothetical protein
MFTPWSGLSALESCINGTVQCTSVSFIQHDVEMFPILFHVIVCHSRKCVYPFPHWQTFGSFPFSCGYQSLQIVTHVSGALWIHSSGYQGIEFLGQGACHLNSFSRYCQKAFKAVMVNYTLPSVFDCFSCSLSFPAFVIAWLFQF